MRTQSLPPVQHRPDIDQEIARLLEQLYKLASSTEHGQAIQHRSGVRIAGNFPESDQFVLQVETSEASYTLVRQPRDSEERMALSPREQEIVQLVSSGHPNKAIARQLAISQHTVNTHVRRIFDKLGVNSRAEMVAYVLQSGLVTRPLRYN